MLAWFGIRGIGSVYYAVYVADHDIRYGAAVELISCVFTVIATSIIVHGISAAPLMELYQRRRGTVPPGRQRGVGQTMTTAPRVSHAIPGACRSRRSGANFTIFSAGFPARSGHGLGSHFGQLGALEGSDPGALGTAHQRSSSMSSRAAASSWWDESSRHTASPRKRPIASCATGNAISPSR